MIDVGAGGEEIARIAGCAGRAAVHRSGIDDQIVVTSVEAVGDPHGHALPQRPAFDIAGDHVQVGIGCDAR